MLELNRDEYWTNANDKRDMVHDGYLWCTDGDEFDKAALLDQYMGLNPLSRCVIDLHADRRGDMSTICINSTSVALKWTSTTYKSKYWQKLVMTFGKARLWDELVNRNDTDTMMARLGYHWVSSEEEE